MAKKPPILTVIDPTSGSAPLAPPPGLGEDGARLWRAIHADYIVTDAAGLETLAQICVMTDRAAECAEAIKRDGGPVIRTKAGLRAHPSVKDELQARCFIVRSLHHLGLDIIPPRNEIGRPSGGGDYRGERR